MMCVDGKEAGDHWYSSGFFASKDPLQHTDLYSERTQSGGWQSVRSFGRHELIAKEQKIIIS